ncbi:hypothetical protein CEUSTIGMA_g9565.t1 [Chlamydomonas eustigma]|uniref:Uncharacterized protein n=1 Tax=Chlamydomonas eustigma TaxID=1157962 RepID=A0A250XGD9_9CHLO|nr:hypothetical protein CEUSTIGMA_g9565.t1 [Chlamydomonas eustigma]|eukprot:GAX82137.1 hypothetical protein CEUSTIGMA_g9565.t1 [Chlamydomonas eustigma]
MLHMEAIVLVLAVAVMQEVFSMDRSGKDLARLWTHHWNTGQYPRCVPCRNVPDGPLAGNGDLGVVIGGNTGSLGLPGSKTNHSEPSKPPSLGLYFGKNDFWGFPGAVTFHASFQHFSIGYLLLSIMDTSGDAVPLPVFTASQSLADGKLSATAQSGEETEPYLSGDRRYYKRVKLSTVEGGHASRTRMDSRDHKLQAEQVREDQYHSGEASEQSGMLHYALTVQALVLSDRNVALTNITVACPVGVQHVSLKLQLGSDNPYNLPLTILPSAASSQSHSLGQHGDGEALKEAPAGRTVGEVKRSVKQGPHTFLPRVMFPASSRPLLSLMKSSTLDSGRFSPVLTPCEPSQLVYNGIRTFKLNPVNKQITIVNNSLTLCLQLIRMPNSRGSGVLSEEDQQYRVVTGSCTSGQDLSIWRLQNNQIRIRISSPVPDPVYEQQMANGSHSVEGLDLCLGVQVMQEHDHISCPHGSYATSPSAQGACQSLQWAVLPLPCTGSVHSKSLQWQYDEISGYLSSRSAPGRCLTSVGPYDTNDVAMSVHVLQGTNPSEHPSTPAPKPSASEDTGVQILSMQCGLPAQLSVSVVTQRDASERYKIKSAEVQRHSPDILVELGSLLAPVIAPERHTLQEGMQFFRKSVQIRRSNSSRFSSRVTSLLVEEEPVEVNNLKVIDVQEAWLMQQQWWDSFYDLSWVNLGGPVGAWAELERFYFAMLYLMRSSMAEGSVAPSLWGPFSTSDSPSWSDDMTLDYNFQANFWSVATANRPEFSKLYEATLLDSRLMPLARQRANSISWSLGGWPDQLGAEVMGMSCGPTPDWDHDYGCLPGFGGFQGIAFVSCTGPFRGMECSFDDGTRFVAGLSATPMLMYYDATQDKTFLVERLLPYLKEVAAFYMSYATWDKKRGVFVLRFTCAQELCSTSSGINPPLAEHGYPPMTTSVFHAQHNNHQDLAYLQMTLSRLLEFTDPQGVHGASASNETRTQWSHLLYNLASFPTAELAAEGEEATLQRLSSCSSRKVLKQAAHGNSSDGIMHTRCGMKRQLVFAEAETDDPRHQPIPTSNGGYPITHLAAIFPAQVIQSGDDDDDVSSQDTAKISLLVDIGRRTADLMNNISDYAPGNGFCLAWPPAAALATRDTARQLLHSFSAAFTRKALPNGWPDLGGGGLEQIGALEAIHLLMLRVRQQDGALLLFPAWPADGNLVSFTRLRARGGHLVSATWNGTGVVSPVKILSAAGRHIVLKSPWSDGSGQTSLCVKASDPVNGHSLPEPYLLRVPRSQQSWTWETARGMEYEVTPYC